MSTIASRDREDDEERSRSPKRARVDSAVVDDTELDGHAHPTHEQSETRTDAETEVDTIDPVAADCTDPGCVLPASHVLLPSRASPTSFSSCATRQLLERDVGITEYISQDVPPIHGIIKQRFTDFLVHEVDLDHQVVHLKSLGKPEPPRKANKSEPQDVSAEQNVEGEVSSGLMEVDGQDPQEEQNPSPIAAVESLAGNSGEGESNETSTLPSEGIWEDRFTTLLSPYFTEESITQLRQMYSEGPKGLRTSGDAGNTQSTALEPSAERATTPEQSAEGKQGRDRGGRGEKGKRQRGRGQRLRDDQQSSAQIFSRPISSKKERTTAHQTVRELFKGKFQTVADTLSDGGSRIVVMWTREGYGRGAGGAPGGRPVRGEYPPYIHCTMQKTNRDTQDALAYLSRTLHVSVKEFGVAGTKDKRGVTVQRVSLRRGTKTVEDIWKAANQIGRRSVSEALSQRGEHGIRIADLCYRKAGLELGMLKGNEFVITLRNLQVESLDNVDRAMDSLKHKGFINYYGMQRFGTAAVPTHTIGLAFLRSDWHKAVSLILQVRPGEHPDVVAARQAWLDDGDLDRALALMPRRVVAERCILESYKRQGGDTRNALGALSTVPRNLRLMYIHAYQSYVWNAIVSERIHTYGCDKAVPGDLVFEAEPVGKTSECEEINEATVADEPTEEQDSRSKKRQPWVPPKVKKLTEADAHNYSIFDVIMPLPGRDVAYPGGSLGKRYRQFLEKDGLDPDNFLRKQKDYTLNGSYRKILQLPKNLTWSMLQYTDPDVALAQADEDRLLMFDPPVVEEDGRFRALQVGLTLGTAAYATMALRELTKTETSSHFQTGLTQASEDQLFRGTVGPGLEQDMAVCVPKVVEGGNDIGGH